MKYVMMSRTSTAKPQHSINASTGFEKERKHNLAEWFVLKTQH